MKPLPPIPSYTRRLFNLANALHMLSIEQVTIPTAILRRASTLSAAKAKARNAAQKRRKKARKITRRNRK